MPRRIRLTEEQGAKLNRYLRDGRSPEEISRLMTTECGAPVSTRWVQRQIAGRNSQGARREALRGLTPELLGSLRCHDEEQVVQLFRKMDLYPGWWWRYKSKLYRKLREYMRRPSLELLREIKDLLVQMLVVNGYHDLRIQEHMMRTPASALSGTKGANGGNVNGETNAKAILG